MKKAFAIALVLTAVLAISAQEQPIDKTVFDNAFAGTSNHAASWNGKLYRLTVTTSVKMTTRPDLDHQAKMIFEYGPNKNYRNIHKSSTGVLTRPRAETLMIGDSIYRREDDGPWTVSSRIAATTSEAPKPPAPPEVPFEVVTAESQFFSLGSQLYKGETANVIKKIEKTTRVNKTTGDSSESTITNTYWIVGGVQRKHELRSATKAATYGANNVIVSEWDVDPTITFQVPTVSK